MRNCYSIRGKYGRCVFYVYSYCCDFQRRQIILIHKRKIVFFCRAHLTRKHTQFSRDIFDQHNDIIQHNVVGLLWWIQWECHPCNVNQRNATMKMAIVFHHSTDENGTKRNEAIHFQAFFVRLFFPVCLFLNHYML